MGDNSVLANCASVTTKDYRRAVACIIRDLQHRLHLTDCDFAESIGCSVGTVRNARNEESDLGAIWLTRIERRYGAGSIDPYLALGGSRGVPLDADPEADALPSTTAAIHKLALARSPNSPGGDRITHGELLEMEGEIDAAMKALTSLKVKCGLIRSAA